MLSDAGAVDRQLIGLWIFGCGIGIKIIVPHVAGGLLGASPKILSPNRFFGHVIEKKILAVVEKCRIAGPVFCYRWFQFCLALPLVLVKKGKLKDNSVVFAIRLHYITTSTKDSEI